MFIDVGASATGHADDYTFVLHPGNMSYETDRSNNTVIAHIQFPDKIPSQFVSIACSQRSP